MKNTLLFCLLAAALSFSSTLQAQIKEPEKFLVSYELKYSYTQDSLDRFWKKSSIPQMVIPVRNAVDMYEITYKGLWLDSTFITAKGVVYVPKTTTASAEMVYCHGTRIGTAQSYGIQDLEQVVTMMHAVDNYIGVFPFYYGFAGGEKEHVYQDSWTEAMATIYMIKACRELYPQINKTTTGDLFLTGYSQGGHASMATHKYLESGSFPEIKLTASSPMSGAYDMTGEQSKSMFRNYTQPHYLPYLILSYQYAYNLWPGDIYEVFKEPYKSKMREVFAQPRTKDFGDVNAMLPPVPGDMLVPEVVEQFKSDTTFPFTCKLKENCLTTWVPKAPLQICACYGDDEVMYNNSEVAYANLKTADNKVFLRLFGKHLSHNPCAPFAILHSKFFFDNFRKGKKHPERFSAGRKLILALGIDIANRQAKKYLKKNGKVEHDALASRKKK
jgi:hypothetical protein